MRTSLHLSVQSMQTNREFSFVRRLRSVVAAVAPALLAGLAVLFEPRLTAWAQGREAILPVVVFLLLSSLIHPVSRHLLVVTLCYAVAFLALRDTFWPRPLLLPPLFDYTILEDVRIACLLVVAVLAAAAGVGETVQSGAVWARRCYFGAASLYFTGLGVITYGWHASWQALLLCAMGAMALYGCLFAPSIVASEIEIDEEALISDDAIQQRQLAAHARALREKEWKDPGNVPPGGDLDYRMRPDG